MGAWKERGEGGGIQLTPIPFLAFQNIAWERKNFTRSIFHLFPPRKQSLLQRKKKKKTGSSVPPHDARHSPYTPLFEKAIPLPRNTNYVQQAPSVERVSRNTHGSQLFPTVLARHSSAACLPQERWEKKHTHTPEPSPDPCGCGPLARALPILFRHSKAKYAGEGVTPRKPCSTKGRGCELPSRGPTAPLSGSCALAQPC